MTVTVGPVITTFDAPGLKDIIKDLQDLQAQIAKVQNQKITIGAGGAGGGFGQFGNFLKSLDAPLRNVSAGLNSMGNGLTRVGQIAATAAYRLEILVAPLQALIIGTGKAAIQLDDQLRQVATQLDTTTAEVEGFVQNYAQGMSTIAIATGQTSSDIAKGMYFIVSSMDATEQQASAMLKPISQFATIGRTDVVGVTKAVTSAFNVFGNELAIYGDTQAQVTQLLSMFLEVIRRGRGEIPDLVTGFGRFASAGELANATLTESLALWTAMSRIFTPAQATTSLENFFRAFTKQSKEATEAFAELGISPLGRDPLTVFVELMERMAELPEPRQIEMIGRIFPNLRGLRGALSIQDVEVLNQIREWMATMADPELVKNFERSFSIMASAPQTALNRLREVVKAIGGDIFRGEQSGFNRFINGLRSLIERIREGGPQTIEFFTKMALTLSALPPIFLAISTATITLGIGLQTLATLISPAGLLAAAGAWAIFGKNIGAIVPAVQEAVSQGGLGGLVRMLVNLGERLGILSESQAFDILSAFGLSLERMNTQKFNEMVDAFERLGKTLSDMKNFVGRVLGEFEEFLQLVAERQGFVGSLVGGIEALAGAVNSLGITIGLQKPNLFDLLTFLSGIAIIARIPGVGPFLAAMMGGYGVGTFIGENAPPWLDQFLSDVFYKAPTREEIEKRYEGYVSPTAKTPAEQIIEQRGKWISKALPGYYTPVPTTAANVLGIPGLRAAVWPGAAQAAGGGVTGGGDTAAADKARSQLESAVRSVLRPTETGAPDPYELLDRLGRHVDTPDEAARRLASVMVEGFGSDWVEFIKNLGILPPEAFQSDIELRAAAAKAYGDFQKGLLPQLYDIDIATQRAKEIFIGQRNMDALVARIMGEFQGLVTGYGAIAGPTIQIGFDTVDPAQKPLLDAILSGQSTGLYSTDVNIPGIGRLIPGTWPTTEPTSPATTYSKPLPFVDKYGHVTYPGGSKTFLPSVLTSGNVPRVLRPALYGKAGDMGIADFGISEAEARLAPTYANTWYTDALKRNFQANKQREKEALERRIANNETRAYLRRINEGGGAIAEWSRAPYQDLALRPPYIPPPLKGGAPLTPAQLAQLQKMAGQVPYKSPIPPLWKYNEPLTPIPGSYFLQDNEKEFIQFEKEAAPNVWKFIKNLILRLLSRTPPSDILTPSGGRGQGLAAGFPNLGKTITGRVRTEEPEPPEPLYKRLRRFMEEQDIPNKIAEIIYRLRPDLQDTETENIHKFFLPSIEVSTEREVRLKVLARLSEDVPEPLKGILEGRTSTVPFVLRGTVITDKPITPPTMEDYEESQLAPGRAYQAGGYAWSDSVYRLGEAGREYVLNNRLTQMLEQRVGGMLSPRNVGRAMGGTTITIGQIALPNVTNAEQFVRELEGPLTKRILRNMEEALS